MVHTNASKWRVWWKSKWAALAYQLCQLKVRWSYCEMHSYLSSYKKKGPENRTEVRKWSTVKVNNLNSWKQNLNSEKVDLRNTACRTLSLNTRLIKFSLHFYNLVWLPHIIPTIFRFQVYFSGKPFYSFFHLFIAFADMINDCHGAQD